MSDSTHTHQETHSHSGHFDLQGGTFMSGPPMQLMASGPVAQLQDDPDAVCGPGPLSFNELIGRFEPADHPGFVATEGTYLRIEVAQAWMQMKDAAAAAGHTINIGSGTRTFGTQMGLFTDRYGRAGGDYGGMSGDNQAAAASVLEFSSMPGTSRHHWGTEIDIFPIRSAGASEAGAMAAEGATTDEINEAVSGPWYDNEYNDPDLGEVGSLEVYQWLEENAASFGFGQSYDNPGASGRTGYSEERWHWSYVPLSNVYLAQYRQCVDNATLTTAYQDTSDGVELDGEGDNRTPEVGNMLGDILEENNVLETYVFSVNPEFTDNEDQYIPTELGGEPVGRAEIGVSVPYFRDPQLSQAYRFLPDNEPVEIYYHRLDNNALLTRLGWIDGDHDQVSYPAGN